MSRVVGKAGTINAMGLCLSLSLVEVANVAMSVAKMAMGVPKDSSANIAGGMTVRMKGNTMGFSISLSLV